MPRGALSPFWRFNRFTDLAGTQLSQPDLGMWLSSDQSELVLYGEISPALEKLAQLARSGVRPRDTMINREVYGALGADLRDFFGPYWGHAWDFFYTDSPLPKSELSEQVRFVANPAPDELERIESALQNANPITDALSELSELSWYICYAPNGEIASVMGARITRFASFSGLGTVEKYRGQGYGAALLSGATNHALSQVEFVRFGVWSWNEGAIRLYNRLGFTYGAGLIKGSSEPITELSGRS